MPRHSKKVAKTPRVESPRITIFQMDEAPESEWLDALREQGFTVSVEAMPSSLSQALLDPPDAMILYFNKTPLPSIADAIHEVRRALEHLPVVCVGPVSRVEDVVTLMKAGAYDCMEMPVVLPKLMLSMAHAVENSRLTKRVSVLESQVSWEGRFENIVGSSPPMQEVFQMIKTVAKSQATVLILGESGTGKELVAKAIHQHSGREEKKFVDINCGAIPKELLENELFGHERGAYTGADRQYAGSVERADGGTLFLDEIGEMDVSLQVKLLRLLQERAFQRIGGTSKKQVDIRVVAATNRDLREMVDKGAFREELYYRLNVVPITLPPLRSRVEDIPLLASFFLEKYAQANQRKFKGFASDAMQAMVSYDWPGNVRELENAIERIVVLHDEIKVKLYHLPRFIQQAEGRLPKLAQGQAPMDAYQKIVPLALVEQYAIESTLAKCNNDVVLAAKKLQIGQATLYRKLKRYGIKY